MFYQKQIHMFIPSHGWTKCVKWKLFAAKSTRSIKCQRTQSLAWTQDINSSSDRSFVFAQSNAVQNYALAHASRPNSSTTQRSSQIKVKPWLFLVQYLCTNPLKGKNLHESLLWNCHCPSLRWTFTIITIIINIIIKNIVIVTIAYLYFNMACAPLLAKITYSMLHNATNFTYVSHSHGLTHIAFVDIVDVVFVCRRTFPSDSLKA